MKKELLVALASIAGLQGHGWGPFRGHSLTMRSGPDFGGTGVNAPRYNQRKARRDARRVNRAVKR